MTTTITLAEPLMQGTEEIKELKLRVPKAKDIRTFSEHSDVGVMLDLAARLANQTPRLIGELCMEDTGKVLEVVQDFLEPIQGIGNDSLGASPTDSGGAPETSGA